MRGKNCGPSISNSNGCLHARETSGRPCQRAVKISTAPTGTDRLMADKPAILRSAFQARCQIEIFGVDHQRLQRHHLKAPVIQTGRQQFGVIDVACRAG
jgi:hypothetical protein